MTLLERLKLGNPMCKFKQVKPVKILLVAYSIIVLYVLLLYKKVTMLFLMPVHTTYREYLMTHINLVPFKTILEYFDTISWNAREALEYLVGHVILFIPIGFLLPQCWSCYRRYKLLVLLVFVSILLVELLQLVTAFGIFDIDDILLTIAGATIGFFIWNVVISMKEERIAKT